MTGYIASYALLRTDEIVPATTPREYSLWSYDNGKVRLNVRGPLHSIDRWYKSFDDVVPLIERLTASTKYKLRDLDGLPYDPYNNPLFNEELDKYDRVLTTV